MTNLQPFRLPCSLDCSTDLAVAAAASGPDSLEVALGVAEEPDYFALDCNPAVAAGVVAAAAEVAGLVVAAVLLAVRTQNPI